MRRGWRLFLLAGVLYSTYLYREVDGAFAVFYSNFTVSGDAFFSHNSAVGSTSESEGGAIYCQLSEMVIDGRATFAYNSADASGGAISCEDANIKITGGKTSDEFPGAEGDVDALVGSVEFIENSAVNLGGAIYIHFDVQVQISNTMFKSNKAALGGAVYTAGEKSDFSACVFEGNEATDGGALYCYTGAGIDTITASVFRGNFADYAGGAIFHTGTLRVSNTSFVSNEVGIEGAAFFSIGYLQQLRNVSFSENMYSCRAGKYGYIVQNEADFCSLCFEEVCAHCFTGSGGDGDADHGNIQTDGLPVCAEPPRGSTAPTSGTTVATLTLERGYYRTSNASHAILECYEAKACPGGVNTYKYCAAGYSGPYCAVCTEGYSPGIAYSCRECSASVTRSAVGYTVALALVLVLLVTVLTSYLWSVVHDGAREDVRGARCSWKHMFWSGRAYLVEMLPLSAIKIVVTVWQIISQFDAIAGDVYPEVYRVFVSNLNPINLDLDFVLSYSCLVTTDFYHRLLFATITPLIVLLILVGSCFIGRWRNGTSETALRVVGHKHQSAVLYAAFAVYSPVSYRIFQTFSCDELDDGNTYLRADYSLSCLTPRHGWYQGYALVMVGVYPLGIAAGFGWLLVRHRRDLVRTDRERLVNLKALNGLWIAYKPSRYYYEVIECGRRIGLTGIAAFVYPNSVAQLSIVLVFAVVFVFISEVVSPFETKADMGLYRWGNGIIVASIYVAFLKNVDVGRDTTGYLLTFSSVLIAANVFMVVAVLIQTVLLLNKWRQVKQAVNG